eukprot:12841069-Heterocapsa_arctica.AAC.1
MPRAVFGSDHEQHGSSPSSDQSRAACLTIATCTSRYRVQSGVGALPQLLLQVVDLALLRH